MLRFRVPKFDSLVHAGRGNAAAVGAERHAVDAPFVLLERGGQAAGSDIPDLHRLVPTGRSNASSVGAERHAVNAVSVRPEGTQLLPILRAPKLDRPIPT